MVSGLRMVLESSCTSVCLSTACDFAFERLLLVGDVGSSLVVCQALGGGAFFAASFKIALEWSSVFWSMCILLVFLEDPSSREYSSTSLEIAGKLLLPVLWLCFIISILWVLPIRGVYVLLPLIVIAVFLLLVLRLALILLTPLKLLMFIVLLAFTFRPILLVILNQMSRILLQRIAFPSTLPHLRPILARLNLHYPFLSAIGKLLFRLRQSIVVAVVA